MYTCCWSLSVHSLCSVSALYPTVSRTPAVPFQSIPSALFQHCVLCLMCTCRSLSVHSLCSVSALYPTVSRTRAGPFQSIPSALFQHCAPLSHVHLLHNSYFSVMLYDSYSLLALFCARRCLHTGCGIRPTFISTWSRSMELLL